MKKTISFAKTLFLSVCLSSCASDRYMEAQTGSTHQGDTSPVKTQPNIVLILADDLAWVDPSSEKISNGHGSTFYHTPNIDKLARQGMVFTAAYTQQNCAPTRASLMSGQFAPKNGVYNVWSLNRESEEIKGQTAIIPPHQRESINGAQYSLPEMLRDSGYFTAHFGKTHGWGNLKGKNKSAFGFDVDFGVEKKIPVNKNGKTKNIQYYAVKNPDGQWVLPEPSSLNQYAKPYSRAYIERNLLPYADGNNPSILEGTPKHLTDALTDAVVDTIADHHRKNKPMFLNVSFHAVHTKIVSRKDLQKKFRLRTPEKNRKHKKTDYAGMMAGLDQSVARIMNALDDPNGDGNTRDSIANNTLVIFLSDNGGTQPTDNLPLRGVKGQFYEGGIRVPFIARWPGRITENTSTAEPIHVVDILPTFVDVAGRVLNDKKGAVHAVDGESLAPLFNQSFNKNHLERDALYWHFPGYMDWRMSQPVSAINQRFDNERYKLLYFYESQTYELYNLTQDFEEKRNLLEKTITEKNGKIARVLSQSLRRYLKKEAAKTGRYRKTGKKVEYPKVFH